MPVACAETIDVERALLHPTKVQMAAWERRLTSIVPRANAPPYRFAATCGASAFDLRVRLLDLRRLLFSCAYIPSSLVTFETMPVILLVCEVMDFVRLAYSL